MIEIFRKIALLMLVVQVACATRTNRGVEVPNNFEGFWRGRMANSSELTRRIDLSVIQSGKTLQGVYRCAFESTTCLNDNTSGRVSGQLGAPSFQVTLQDASVCRFSGEFASDSAGGQYSCYSGGNLIDHGTWQISHSDNN
jgi:hypothetical protein